MVEKLQGGKRPKGWKRVCMEWSCLARCPGFVWVYSNSLGWCNFLNRSFTPMVYNSPGICLWWSHPLQSQEPFPQGSWKAKLAALFPETLCTCIPVHRGQHYFQTRCAFLHSLWFLFSFLIHFFFFSLRSKIKTLCRWKTSACSLCVENITHGRDDK